MIAKATPKFRRSDNRGHVGQGQCAIHGLAPVDRPPSANSQPPAGIRRRTMPQQDMTSARSEYSDGVMAGLCTAIHTALVVRHGCRQVFSLRRAGSGTPELRLPPWAGAGTTAARCPSADGSFRPADQHQPAQVGAGQFKIADDSCGSLVTCLR